MSLDRWLLVNYAGYLFSANSLMPDNGLANLAGVLLQTGKNVTILDYCTVSTIHKLSTPRLTRTLRKAWGGMNRGSGISWPARMLLLIQLLFAEAARQRLQRAFLREIRDQLFGRIRRDHIDAVGFKLWNGDGFSSSITLAKQIKLRFPQVKVFAGGSQVDYLMDLILVKAPCFDALVYGEGEDTIRHLAERGDDPSQYPEIPNLLFRRNGRVQKSPPSWIEDLDALPFPVYDELVYPAMQGDDKIKIIVVDESRGCKNHCAFCIHPIKSNRRVRMKSVPRLIREVDRLRSTYGIDTFRFAGSCTPYELLNEFSREIIASGRGVTYASFAHIREGDEADFASIRASGCRALFFGIESGSEPILTKMEKGVRPQEISSTLKAAKAAGIFTVGSLIFPAPGDDAHTEQETLDLLIDAELDASPTNFPVVTPRTSWFDKPENHGFSIPDRKRYLNELFFWKVKMILPPQFWSELSIRLQGRKFRDIAKETGRFIARLEAAGVPTSIPDDLVLMGVRSGEDVVHFRDLTREMFFTGDDQGLRKLVNRINRGSGSAS